MTKSVSVIVTAYNEEDNIKNSIKSTFNALHALVTDYEIIVIDDGSTDQTFRFIKDEIAKNTHIRVIRHLTNKGVGISFRDALAVTTKNYVTVFPGDNDMSSESLRELIKRATTADLVIAFPTSQHRSLKRKILSYSFTNLLNLFFKLKIKYYNGPFIVKRGLLNKLNLISTGFLIFAEFKLKLIRRGYSYVEIPFVHVGRKHGRSKAVSLSNLIDMAQTTLMLLFDKNLTSS